MTKKTNGLDTAKEESPGGRPDQPGLSIGISAETVKVPEADPPRARQSNAPICPYCKNEAGDPYVVCKAQGSSPYFTRYSCPTKGCPFRAQIPRPRIADRVQAARESDVDFSARPKQTDDRR